MKTSPSSSQHFYRYDLTYVFRPHLLGEDPWFDVVCPLPVSDGYQDVERLDIQGDTAPSQMERDERGNALWSGRVQAGQEVRFQAALSVRPFRLGETRLNLPGPTAADRQAATMVPITAAISALARQLTADCSTDEARARTLFQYVRQILQYQYPPEGRGAETTRRSGRGDCGEYANLLCALCRAVGVPARPVFGWLCAPWFSGAHAWAELWLDAYGWIPADANLARESRYWGPLLGVSSHPDFYFGNLDGYRLVLSRGTALAWPHAMGTAPERSEPQLRMEIDGQPVQFWGELVSGSIPYLQLPYTLVHLPRTGRQLKVGRLFSVQPRARRLVLPPSLTALATLLLQPRYILALIALGFASAILPPLFQMALGSDQFGFPLIFLLRLVSDIGTLLLLLATLAGFAMRRGSKDYFTRGTTVAVLGWLIYSLVLPRWGLLV